MGRECLLIKLWLSFSSASRCPNFGPPSAWANWQPPSPAPENRLASESHILWCTIRSCSPFTHSPTPGSFYPCLSLFIKENPYLPNSGDACRCYGHDILPVSMVPCPQPPTIVLPNKISRYQVQFFVVTWWDPASNRKEVGNKHPDLSRLALQFPTSASHFPKLKGSPQARPFGEKQDREQGERWEW